MIERTPQTPPVIKPVEDTERPLWSVMIPVYNCIEFLKITLECVLCQDPGPDKMQIEVVDDASTDGDVKALVEEIGKGRVGYFRQQENVGSLRNFETCLNRSKGHLIHLLHGDDMIKPGFYQEMEWLFEEFPTIGSAFCKYSFINKNSNENFIAESLLEFPGIIPDWLEKCAVMNLPQPPAVVVKRSVYEHLGGFFAVHYGEDWEMWSRIAANYPVAYTPKCLAMYRTHANNITTSSHLSGQSIKDIEKVINIIQSYLTPEKRRKIKSKSKEKFAIMFSVIACRNFYGNRKKYFNLAVKSLMFDANFRTVYFLSKIVLNYLIPSNIEEGKVTVLSDNESSK